MKQVILSGRTSQSCWLSWEAYRGGFSQRIISNFAPSQPPQRKVYEAAHRRGVGREEQLHWRERSLAQERARVREGAETIHSMRTACSAVVEPAKRQIGMHKVQHGIIDARTTGRGACGDLCNVSAAAAEDV